VRPKPPVKPADPVPAIRTDKLAQLRLLVDLLDRELEAADSAEKISKLAAARARAISEEDIPELLAELELAGITLEDGSKVAVKSEVYASISEDRKDRAFEWLEKNGFGDIIRTSIALSFAPADSELCGKVFDLLAKRKDLAKAGIVPELSRGVHAGTLKAFLRERLEAGTPKDLPLDLFAARPVKVAKITKPKPKR